MHIIRDVNLPLFGEIPLFFFFFFFLYFPLFFFFFFNDFPLFLKNRTQKKKKMFVRLPTPPLSSIDHSMSFGKQSVTSWFRRYAFLPFVRRVAQPVEC